MLPKHNRRKTATVCRIKEWAAQQVTVTRGKENAAKDFARVYTSPRIIAQETESRSELRAEHAAKPSSGV